MEPHRSKGWNRAARCLKFRDHHLKSKALYEAARQLCALSLSCRQLHSEAALLPFALSDFDVGGPWPRRGIPEHCLRMMSPEQRGALQCLIVLDWIVNDSGFWELLVTCHTLQRLIFWRDGYHGHLSDGEVAQFKRKVYYWAGSRVKVESFSDRADATKLLC